MFPASLEGDVRRTELAFVLALLSVAPHALDADSGQRGQEAKGLLQSLAKTPGPHIERIKAMGDNSWINLGQAAPCSRFPRKKVARGRAWAGKMAFVPELRGAFFCGTGSHGAVPDGYYMDDLWFYDVNAHKWICLYPGATKLTQLKLDENGFEVVDETPEFRATADMEVQAKVDSNQPDERPDRRHSMARRYRSGHHHQATSTP